MTRNYVRDAVYGILNHCQEQKDNNSYLFRNQTRHPMAQTGQINDQMVNDVLSLGIQILQAALGEAANGDGDDNDVLTTALNAYKQGLITKNQYMAVIDALDETPVYQRANLDLSSIIKSN